MKLNKQQIAQIDETLVLNKVVYDDIKLELTDHIASNIEEIMADENVSFETAFKEAFGKWKIQLKEETIPLFPGTFFWKSGPKIVIDKWIKETRVQFWKSLLVSICITVLSLLAKGYFNFSVLEKVCEISCKALFFLLIIGRVLKFISKTKTVFGNIFNIYFVLYMFFGLNATDIFRHFQFTAKGDFYSPPIALFFITHASFSIFFLYKHFQFEKKLSKA